MIRSARGSGGCRECRCQSTSGKRFPTTPRRGTYAPDHNSHKTQHHRPFTDPSFVFPDSPAKHCRVLLKDVDLENGALRLPLRLVVSSKHIYGEGVKKKRVY